MSKILTEKSNTLSYVKEDLGKDKHYLGKLAGIGAEFNKPTRNGRRYPLELWRNIENSDDFKEGMQTHTIFGECDHPETRVETSIKEIAIVLTKFEIREKEGNVYTEFHILDTPNGRILKELLDYGSQIGVSTRGLGDEVVQDGETIIDPNTYCFYGWDAVVMPAVKNARPTVVESKKAKSLIESLNKEINSANSVDELKSIERVVNKLPALSSVKESISDRLNLIRNGGDDISSKIKKDLGSISEENVRLSEEIESLKSQLVADNIRISRLKEQLKNHKKSEHNLRKNLQGHMVTSKKQKTTVENLNSKYKKLKNAYDEVSESLYESVTSSGKADERIKEMKCRVNEAVHSAEMFNANLNNSKAEIRALNNKVSAVNKELAESKQRVSQLRSANQDVQYQYSKMKKKYEESQAMVDRLQSEKTTLNESLKSKADEKSKLVKENEALKQKQTSVLSEKKKSAEISHQYEQALGETLKKYLETKCSQNGIKKETVERLLPEKYTIQDIDKVVSELSDKKRRYDALPFVTSNQQIKIVESVQNLSDEDKQTMAFLQSAIK